MSLGIHFVPYSVFIRNLFEKLVLCTHELRASLAVQKYGSLRCSFFRTNYFAFERDF